MGDPRLEACSPSEWAGRAEAERAALAFLARASAVSLASPSTVPVWWFWWRVRVVRLVKVFWHEAYGHLYGLLPE